MYGGSASRNQTSQKGDRRSQKEETRGLYHRHMPEVSTPGELPSSHEREVGVVDSLLLPHTPPRTLWPVHATRGANLHMLGEVLWHLIQFGITSPTEECDFKVLPRMTVSSGGVFICYPTVWAECYLLSQIFAIINGHPRQTILLVDPLGIYLWQPPCRSARFARPHSSHLR